MSIEFVDPPAVKHGSPSKWEHVFVELRANPNRWALVGNSTSTNLGHSAARAHADIERTIRSNPNGGFDIYMRAVSA